MIQKYPKIFLCKRQVFNRFFFILFLMFAWTQNFQAQPELSADELRQLKQHKYLSDGLKYRLPHDKLPMPDAVIQNRPTLADGDLDATFNASVTESFGYVNETVVQPDGKIIAVGLFQRANGARTNGIARFNADGTLDTSFNTGTGATFPIRAVALQTDGKIIIAGAFTVFNGQTVPRIVRLNADGSIDSTFTSAINFNDQINDVVIQPDGKILVGGHFSTSSSRLVRLNANGTLDIIFSGFGAVVRKIIYTANDKILVGGDPGRPSRAIRRINADGTDDTSFNPGTGPNSSVYEIVVQPDDKILLGGIFDFFNGTATDAIVRINGNGSLDTAFDYLPSNIFGLEVNALTLQSDGKILANYYYNDATGNRSIVARFNANASADSTFNNGDTEDVPVIDINLLANGKILIGGLFVAFNNQTHIRLAQLNSDGTLDNSFNASASTFGSVNAIKRQTDGKILIGGDFEFVNGVRKSSLARLNADGTLDNTFTSTHRIIGDVFTLFIQPDGKIFVGGSFVFNTVSAYGIVRYNPDGSLDSTFNFSSTDIFLFFVYASELQSDGKILLGGQITPTSLTPQTVLRLNSNGSIDSTFSTLPLNSSGRTRAITIQPDGRIIIGGTFNAVNSNTRHGIARLNANGTLDTGFTASSILVQFFSFTQQTDGKVVAAGNILRRFAAADGAIDATFNPGTGVNSLIRGVEVQPDGKILIGGAFITYNGASAVRIARINSTGSLDTTFSTGAGPSGAVLSIALQPDGKVLAGGQFLDFNSTEKLSLVRLQNTAAPRRAPFDFDGDNKTDISIFRPAPGEWWYLRSSDGGNRAFQFGAGTDKIVPADYTGDGKTDVAFWRPSTGNWFILRSEDSSFFAFPFGTSGDVPVPADYDGDGKSDAAVFRESSLTWFISKSTGGTDIIGFGATGDKPAVADYDGDGKADIAIYRPNGANGAEWWIRRSSNGSVFATQFGAATDKPVQGDYTGDGKTDIAFWRPSNGNWFILRSEDFSFYAFPFGTSGDVPVAGDYDGDGRFDAGVFRPTDLNWYVQRSTAGTLIQQFGIVGDLPIPNAFVP